MNTRRMRRSAFAAIFATCCANYAFAQNSEVVTASSEKPIATAAASQPLGKLYLNQWVQMRASGEVVGNVVSLAGESSSPVSKTRVALVKDGKIVSEALTNAQGQFVLPRVQPGLYTIVARGSNTLGAFSLAVLDVESGRHLPAEFSVPVAEIQDRSIDSFFAAQQSPNREALVRSTELVTDPLGRSRNTAARDYKVALDAEGTLHGDLALPGVAPAQSNTGGMNVILFHQGREVARAVSDQFGHYKFPGLKPGAYGIVVNGETGFAALAVCAIDRLASSSLSMDAGNGNRFVSANLQEGADSAQTEVTENEDAAVVDEFVLEPDPAFIPTGPQDGFPVGGAPIGGGGGGGGGGGLGGAGGLGGRLGPALAIGGGIAAAALVANDDDNPNTTAQATPIQ